MSDGIINIHGKEYRTVAYRVNDFRSAHTMDEGWSIDTEILEANPEFVLMKAYIRKDGLVVATGHAEEFRSNRGINSTSALENCETSAVGRALAAAGYGGTEYASANEVITAIESGTPHESWFADEPEFMDHLTTLNWTWDELVAFLRGKGMLNPLPDRWTSEKRGELLHKLRQDPRE